MKSESPTNADPVTPGQRRRIREIAEFQRIAVPNVKTKGEATAWISKHTERRFGG